jgi:hypothetical protein
VRVVDRFIRTADAIKGSIVVRGQATSRSFAAALGLCLGIGAAACSDLGTSTDPTPIVANQVVEADLTRGVRTRFVFATSVEAFRVYFQATSGSATMVVTLHGGELLRSTVATASNDDLDRHLVGQVNLSSPGEFEIALTGAGHARFKLVELP